MSRMLSSLAIVLLVQLAFGTWPTIEFVYIHRVPPGEMDARDPVIARCHSIPPGVCCIPHRSGLLLPHENLDNIEYGATAFIVLQPQQLGFGWGATGPNYQDIRCDSGSPILRLAGPNAMPFDPWDEAGGYTIYPPGGNLAEEPATPDKIVFAASWIDLRRHFPPNSADARYLQWQGVRGLVWGSGRWTAESQGIPFPKRDRTEALDSWAPHGTAYLQAPKRWRRPDLYSINGTNYTGSGDGIYKAGDGRSLNLTDGAI
ncbi:MAG: hypothetical protein LQ338_003234 [Usnochroma carphineum]|nr:MAG: hypothetical protein LQ338_003234 [Usnochroma carphineum]